jgi:hypothetical protein
MGRTKSHVDSELTFAPKISDNSRKLALLKIYAENDESAESGCVVTSRSDGQSVNGVPHFMKSTISNVRRESVTSLAPLKKVPSKIKTLLLEKKISKVVKKDYASKFTNLSLRVAKDKGARIHAEIMAKAAAMHTPPNSGRIVDSETFTFKPKVSSRSASIAESLGTDFMARNQQHIEKQKKLVSILMSATVPLRYHVSILEYVKVILHRPIPRPIYSLYG